MVQAIAPRLDHTLWRPVLAADPLCTVHDLFTWVTLDHLMQMHEALDLRGALAEAAESRAQLNNGGRGGFA
ncbi:hypothetical protein D8780_01530 [Notoacmeibacter ruber]|uniref:Uncharacterized protein n=2 Tax=Notoacmeibacter ruber TaxID=2670375 RepID=A0A3L7JGJ1_9HYPH|nr:hypothetical protein D8780_01530 [Notoacmeibacter ruber]